MCRRHKSKGARREDSPCFRFRVLGSRGPRRGTKKSEDCSWDVASKVKKILALQVGLRWARLPPLVHENASTGGIPSHINSLKSSSPPQSCVTRISIIWPRIRGSMGFGDEAASRLMPRGSRKGSPGLPFSPACIFWGKEGKHSAGSGQRMTAGAYIIPKPASFRVLFMVQARPACRSLFFPLVQGGDINMPCAFTRLNLSSTSFLPTSWLDCAVARLYAFTFHPSNGLEPTWI